MKIEQLRFQLVISVFLTCSGLWTPLIGFTQCTNNSNIAQELIEDLSNGDCIGKYFKSNWTFIYHEYNRCDGSTDGNIDNLNSWQIDSIIKLNVKNDGNGWACDTKEPKAYDLEFNLKAIIGDWDRFKISNHESHNKSIIYIVGAGESDYLKLHFNKRNLIVKLEYRSEDPG
ncbi:MAG: hypothetical protein MI922_18960 [Bacteroidales bacterium]|nr:hypothetical protein [Bacteroidales bacterium]